MAAGRASILNLDADLELGALAVGRRYAPTAAVRDAMAPHVAVLAAGLLDEGDILVDEATPAGAARGRPGRAFCPTPRALAILTRAGADLEATPPAEVLVEVNGRVFSARLGETLRGGDFVRNADVATTKIRTRPPSGFFWRAKRAHSMAGRGQRRIDSARVDADDDAFVRAAIEAGGVQIEPDVRIARELAIHGILSRTGALERGRVVVQQCDPRGQWLSSRAAEPDEVSAAIRDALGEELGRVATALEAAGYWGPFGIDAFEYVLDGQLARRLQPRSEINARYSMGFAAGFGRLS